MNVSIFTPTNDSSFLMELYDSIKDQDFHEWIIVYNNGGVPVQFDDARVKTHILFKSPEFVGAVKAYACDKAVGDILLEVDHDDLLMPDAVSEVKQAFEDDEIGFVYSNSLRATRDLKPVQRFDEAYGWRYRTVVYKGNELDECVAFDPSPASVSRIWFAPDHLRAFRKSVYDKIGGYAKDMRVLDDQDLMSRMYTETKFKHIDKALYVYRIHEENTWLKNNKEIQDNVYRLYDKYIEGLVLKWCDDNKLRALDLGGGMRGRGGFEHVDMLGDNDKIIKCNLNSKWPFEDNSVGLIRAADVFEHLKDPIHAMKEAYRVLVPGGYIFVQVPSTDGRGAFQDPTHVSFWNENSFYYYTQREYAKFIRTPVRFQTTRLFTSEKDKNQVCWTTAHMVSLKDGYRPPGKVDI